MVQKISIAFEAFPGFMTGEEKRRGMKRLQELQIDRAFRLICSDPTVRDSFFLVLSRPLPTLAEALGRGETMELFYAHPHLLERLTELVRKLITGKTAWDTERSRMASAKKIKPGDTAQLLANAKDSLVLSCHFLKLAVRLLAEITAAIDHFSANSGYLGRLRDACAAASQGETVEELMEFCDRCEKHLHNALSYEVDFSVDAEFMADSFMMSDFSYLPPVRQKKREGGLLSLLTARTRGEEKNVHLNTQGNPDAPFGEFGTELAAKGVAELDRSISAMAKGLMDRFSSLEEELYFYQGCMKYMEFLESLGFVRTFPKLLEHEKNTLRIEGLCDLLLLAERREKESVVANNVDIGRSGETVGMLIMGENNSGKTVFLRSVGTAVLLGQCGLPIPAEKGEISLRKQIFTHFAKAEGELLPLSQAGRFEEEAAELAQIVDRMEPHSLLLLNETFQTTAYDEGAEGIYHILRYLSRRGCGFVFVTHLTRLAEMCRGKAILARTETNPDLRYKIRIENFLGKTF